MSDSLLYMYKRHLAICCVCVCCLALFGQTRRALVIGIGKQQDASWGKINGDKDVPYIMSVLQNSGYKKNNITTLINETATKANIVSSFKNLARICSKNDVVYVHFSGHGQRVSDIDGDEEDGWDESWIPYDAYKMYGPNDRGEKHLIDDEIYSQLNEIRNRIGKGGKLLVVVDACHSAGSSYNFEQLPLNLDILHYKSATPTRGVADLFVIPHKKQDLKVTKLPERWLILSACKSHQFNQEMLTPKVGILSYAIYVLSKNGAIDMTKIEHFFKLNKGALPQTPQLSGEVSNYTIADVLR